VNARAGGALPHSTSRCLRITTAPRQLWLLWGSRKFSPYALHATEDLWGGELPEFESIGDVNELIGALVNGLWNALTRHQKRTDPFRLTLVTSGLTRQDLCDLALIRRQELDGFVEGLFNGLDRIDLPQKGERVPRYPR